MEVLRICQIWWCHYTISIQININAKNIAATNDSLISHKYLLCAEAFEEWIPDWNCLDATVYIVTITIVQCFLTKQTTGVNIIMTIARFNETQIADADKE